MFIEILIAVLLGGTIFAFFYFKKENEPKETSVVESSESNETKKKSKAKKPIKKQNVRLISFIILDCTVYSNKTQRFNSISSTVSYNLKKSSELCNMHSYK